MKSGKVYLVGAGPGDEGLITVRGKEILTLAEVVVYDYLVNPVLLEICSTNCEKLYVGKRAGDHSMKQDAINDLLVAKALEGKMVVRLKGGDPFVFGRGGEEVLALVQHNIPFEVVPGVTAGVAVPAYAGIPVTHREIGTTVTFVTGHLSKDNTLETINWDALGKLNGTLVFYMGVVNLPRISEMLISNGKNPKTPVALIRFGTYPTQESIFGELDNIAAKVAEARFMPPALIVVGDVVALHDRMDWLAHKPLYGKRILVTRSREQASTLSTQLRERGADVVELPVIAIKPTLDKTELNTAIGKLNQYEWLIFTSVNGVENFFEQLFACGKDARALASCKTAIVGRETAVALRRFGIAADLHPEKFTSEALAETFEAQFTNMKGQRILIPTSAIAREVLPSRLRQMGAQVDVVTAYINEMPEYTTEYLNEIFEKNFDLITFTSSSTVTNLAELLQKHNFTDQLSKLKGASIGPVTSKSMQDCNIHLAFEADEHTILGLVQGVEMYIIGI